VQIGRDTTKARNVYIKRNKTHQTIEQKQPERAKQASEPPS
jgi:hypothetical protein